MLWRLLNPKIFLTHMYIIACYLLVTDVDVV